MDKEAKQTSLVIDSVAKAVANWTVDQHAEMNPELISRYGTSWRADWIGHTLSQIHLLAQAVAVRSKDLFARSARWTHASFKLRGVHEADLLDNTRCMQDVLAKELPPAVGKLATDFVDAAIHQLESSQPGVDGDALADSKHSEIILEYLQAILEGDRAAAERRVMAAIENGVTVSEIYEDVLSPAQARLGQMWHCGEISVADEHFGSTTTQAVMSRLRPHFQQAASNGRVVVATSTPGDLHDIGLRMVADLFEVDGWTVIFLGANTPILDVIELLERRHPHLLALSVSTALTLRDAGELIDRLRATETVAQTKVLIGGPPFRTVADLWRELGADGCAATATEAVKLGNQLVAP